MKTFLCLLALLALIPSKTIAVRPPAISPMASQLKTLPQTYPAGYHFTKTQINALLAGTKNTDILRQLIQCESQDVNIARPDSNGLISYGLLQFNGTATWAQFSRLANVTGSPMMPDRAIEVADWMISHGELGRWTCAHILHMV